VNSSVEKIDLSTVQFTPELLRTIPAATVRLYRVLPVFDGPESLCIALPDGSKLEVIDELCFILGRSLDIRQAERHQLDTFIARLYREGEN
jgi:hypothetical protein